MNNINAHKVETTLTEDGMLLLKGLPFYAGDFVEVIILQSEKLQTQIKSPEKQNRNQNNRQNINFYPLCGKVIRYDDPTEPVGLEKTLK